MMKRAILVVVLLVAIAFVADFRSRESTRHHKSDLLGVEFVYPRSWLVGRHADPTDSDKSTGVLVYETGLSPAHVPTATSMVMIYAKKAEGLSLDQWADRQGNHFRDQFLGKPTVADFRYEKLPMPFTVSGQPAIRITTSIKYRKDPVWWNGFPSIVAKVGDTVFLINTFYQDGKAEACETALTAILKSFEVVAPPKTTLPDAGSRPDLHAQP